MEAMEKGLPDQQKESVDGDGDGDVSEKASHAEGGKAQDGEVDVQETDLAVEEVRQTKLDTV